MDISHPKARKYCLLVTQLLGREFKNKSHSAILFGSHARNQATEYSDVDLLIVLKDSSSNLTKRRLSSFLIYLDQNFLAHDSNSSNKILNRILYAVKYKTGMFKPFFITSEKDLKSLHFSKVFGVSFFLSKILAPGNEVFYNIKKDGKLIYGDVNIFDKINVKKTTTTYFFRPLFMNLTISLCALILRPLASEMRFYSLEALKWTILHKYKKNKISRLNIEKQINHPLFSLQVLISVFKMYMN